MLEKISNEEKELIDSVIFCQASGDIPSILEKINSEKNTYFLLLIFNKINILNFFEILNLSHVKLKFVKQKLINIKNPFSITKEFFNLHYINRNILSKIRNKNIFVYYYFFDNVACYCIEKLKNNNKLFLRIPHPEKFNFIEIFSLKTIKLLFSTIYSSNLSFFKYNDKNTYGFTKKYADTIFEQDYVSKKNYNKIYNKYSVDLVKDVNFILISISEDDFLIKRYKNYSKTIKLIYSFLEKNNTFCKSKPGYSPSGEIVENFNLKFISSNIPFEFIDLSRCRCIISFPSTILYNLSSFGKKRVNIRDMFEYRDQALGIQSLKTHEMYSNDLTPINDFLNMSHPKNINEFKSIINSL